jgi:hypothetical protein
MRLSLLAVVAVLVLSGCNTYYQHVYEKIMVRTPGVDNANCDIYTDDNRYSVITPNLVLIERRDEPLKVICKKTGYYPASVIVKSRRYTPKAGMNAVNGYLPGVLYDTASNSIYDYPDLIIVTLLPLPPEKTETGPEPYVIQKKLEDVKPAPPPSAPPPSAADKSLSTSGKK